jgi:hypothetical protein
VGFGSFCGFTAVATYKMYKISRFWVFSGDWFPWFPEIRESGNSGTHLCTSGISWDFGKSLDLEKPCFTETAWQGTPGDLGKSGDFGISEIRGHFYKLWKFPKIWKPEIPEFDTFALFFFALFVFPVQRCEKVKLLKPQNDTFWGIPQYTFSPEIFSRGVFRGFRYFQLRIRGKISVRRFRRFEKKSTFFKSPAVPPTVHLYMRRKSEHRSQKRILFFSGFCIFKNYEMREISEKKDVQLKITPYSPLLRRGSFPLLFFSRKPLLEIASKKKWIFCSIII